MRIRGTPALLGIALGGSLIVIASACFERDQPNPWSVFLESPSVESRKALLEVVDPSECDWGRSVNERVVPDDVRAELMELISSGNEQAFLFGLAALRCFDGGDLEDLYVSAGKFLEAHPREFFLGLREESVSDRDAQNLAWNIPINDDPKSASAEMKRRVAVVEGMDAKGIEELQRRALSQVGR